jgi:hypothetical protein
MGHFQRSSPGACTLRLVCLALTVWLGGTGTSIAQDASAEFWPEIDTWLRISPAWRFSAFTSLSKNIETHYREGSLILQVDYAFGTMKGRHIRRLVDEGRGQEMKRLLVRSGYLRGKSLGDDGEIFTERSALVELHLRTPFKGDFLVSHRVRTDFRWLGTDYAFSTRVRYRLMMEKEYNAGRTSIVPYVNGEVYYDSHYATVNRVRLMGGATIARWPHFGLEGNITYQRDSRSSVTNLYALNLILHLFFETGSAREKD